MKKIIYFCLLLAFTFANAQNNLEAKMAYQMAEEKFEAKEYGEALDNLKNAEKALGSINPPMAYLKVMIVDQIAAVYEKKISGNETIGKQAFTSLEKALADFEKIKGKEALGEDKLIDVYRVKMNFEKRKLTFETKANRNETLRKSYFDMIDRLAAGFPKTETTVSDFIASLPESWEVPLLGGAYKFNEKRIKRVVMAGGDNVSPSYKNILRDFGVYSLKTHNKGEDRIKEYDVLILLKSERRKFKDGKRNVSFDEICGILNISKEMGDNFISSEEVLIGEFKNNYAMRATKIEKGVDGEKKEFSIGIMKETNLNFDQEFIRVVIFKNTY